MHPSDADLVLRMLLAVGLGAALGVERQLVDEVAGFRTHVLVALGAALFSLVSVRLFTDTRIAAQIVTGVGFLGAAAVIRSGTVVRGVATAASLWVVAAVGMATAYGFWQGALVATFLAIVVLRAARRFETNVLRRYRTRRAELVIGLPAGQRLDTLVQRLEDSGILVRSMQCAATEAEQTATLTLEIPARLPPSTAVDAVRPVAQVRSLTWSV